MRTASSSVLVAMTLLGGMPDPAGAQDLTGLFRQVSPSVVVIRARGREVTAAGQTRCRWPSSSTINTARQLLLEKRSFWGGLEGQIPSNELADLLNLPPNATGYLIKSVAEGSPADEAGLRGGTTVATIDGEEIVLGGDIVMTVEGIHAGSAVNMSRIRDLLAGLEPGAPIELTILRAGRVLVVTASAPAADR